MTWVKTQSGFYQNTNYLLHIDIVEDAVSEAIASHMEKYGINTPGPVHQIIGQVYGGAPHNEENILLFEGTEAECQVYMAHLYKALSAKDPLETALGE